MGAEGGTLTLRARVRWRAKLFGFFPPATSPKYSSTAGRRGVGSRRGSPRASSSPSAARQARDAPFTMPEPLSHTSADTSPSPSMVARAGRGRVRAVPCGARRVGPRGGARALPPATDRRHGELCGNSPARNPPAPPRSARAPMENPPNSQMAKSAARARPGRLARAARDTDNGFGLASFRLVFKKKKSRRSLDRCTVDCPKLFLVVSQTRTTQSIGKGGSLIRRTKGPSNWTAAKFEFRRCGVVVRARALECGAI